MRIRHAIGIFFLLLVAQSFAVEIGADVNSVRILSVSTLIDTDNSQRVGSINGGTRLYIKIVGHDAHVASNNSIFVGPYPCLIPEMGVNEIFITCVTTPAYDTTQQWGLNVLVQTVGRSDSQCAQSDASLCTFTYDGSQTPILDQIVPRSITVNDYFSWWGNFRISNTNQIDKMMVGNLLCDRFTIALNEDDPFNGDSYSNLDCEISITHPAGFYPSNFISKPGKAINRSKLTTVRSTTLDTPYDIQVVATQANMRPAQTISSQGGYILSSVHNIPTDLSGVTGDWLGHQCQTITLNNGDLSCRLPSGLSNPTVDTQLRYTSGSGVRLQIYNTDSWSVDDMVTRIKANPAKFTKTDDLIIPSTEYGVNTDQDDLSRQFFIFTGYFTPTVDGTYYFQSSSQYQSKVLFQTSGDSTDETTMTVINTTVEGTELRQPYTYRFDTQQTISGGIQLSAGKPYYFVIYALGSNPQYFHHSTGVRIPLPATNTKQYINQVGQVSRVRINYDFTKEVISIQYNDRTVANKSYFLIHFINPFGAKVKDNAIQWTITTTQFTRDSSCQSLSNHFQYYNNVRSTCVLKDVLDSNQVKIGTIWELTFLSHRTQIRPTFAFDSKTTDTPVYTVVRDPAVNLSGTFRMKVNSQYVQVNKSSDIPYNTPDWVINSSIQNILGTTNIDSSRMYEFIDGAHWVFDFYGIQSPVTVEVVVAETKLVGEPGKSSITVDTLREASNQLNYPAIENELLSQRQANPYLLIRVNGTPALADLAIKQNIVSVLADTDAYTFTGFTDDDNGNLTITGITSSDPNPLSLNFQITYSGQPCTIVTYAAGTVTCQYTGKIAGIYRPEVYYFKNGIALSTAALRQTNPVISSLSQSTVYSFGGSQFTITGKFFPSQITSDLRVTIDGKDATIVSTSNTLITIITPGSLTLGSTNVVVIYQTLSSNNQPITVNDSGAITITNIDKVLVSPVDKTLITVTGTNFGTDKKQLAAYLDALDNSGNTVTAGKYQVNVVEAGSTYVKILLGGGLAGKYRLRVAQLGQGSNIPPAGDIDKVQYNILISNFDIQTSSINGGATLTVTGQNFSTTLTDNQVLVVYSPIDSEFCIITSATTTQIKCTLPNMSTHVATGVTSQVFNVEVYGKLIAQAIVDPQSSLVPSITFQQSYALAISAVSSAWQAYSLEYTITGASLPTNIADVKVIIVGNEGVSVIVTSATATAIKYLTPNLPTGQYSLVIRTVKGDSNALKFNVAETIVSTTPSTNTVSVGGQELIVNYSGALPDQDPIFKFNGVKADVLSYNAVNGQVVVRLPATPAGTGVKLLLARGANIPLDSTGNIPWVTYSKTFNVVPATFTVTTISVSGTDVTLTGTGLDALTKAYLQTPNQPKSTQYTASITSKAATTATISFSNSPAGSYQIYLLNAGSQYPIITNASVNIDIPSLTLSAVTSSFAGGQQITITGSRFNVDSQANNVVTICGNEATVVSVNASTLVVSTPIAYTKASLAAYGFPADQYDSLDGFTTFGNDPQGNSQYLGDGDQLFYYSSTIAGACYAGFDFGTTRVALSKFELYPRSQGFTDASAFFGSKFQASNDNVTWVDLITIGTEFHLGKNMYLIDTLYNTNSQNPIYKQAYRYFRISDSTGISKCQLVEIDLYGWKSSAIVESGTTLTCPISVQVNGSTVKSTGVNVTYDTTKTYQVQSISPNYGDISGNTNVVITLDRAITGTATVLIDGVPCNGITQTGATISCQTAAKTTSAQSSLIVSVNGFQAVNNGIVFYYGLLWSNDKSWGGDFSPIDGDLVYVNENTTIIVDVPYVGVLNTVIVEQGTLIFANDMDIHFEANNILVREGTVIIGTEASPVTGHIRITMHGNQNDKQFPTVGNKGLSVHNGSIDIHGQTRQVTWTELSTTAIVGDTQIQVFTQTGFDWAVGESIVIASSDFVHGHAERRTIKTITNNGSTALITFDDPLLVRHISVVETVNGKSIPMRAEVGLLSRNVIYEGDASSDDKTYGAHIMLHGAYTSARIRYAEFTRTGQPSIIGRYPIHFHMVGDVSGSIVEGNAVHDSYARVLTIHATHYLQVKNNVGYNCAGHNIFLEDGIETNNVIESNLIIGTRQVWSMLQSDITAASYWITNPLNRVVNNRAGGGDFYGFWYEIKEKPDGPSARNDICPQGMALGEFNGNVAHSYDRFGLRIFVLTNLKYPCQPYRDDSKANPFSDNPSFQILFQNFVSYRNHEDGVLAEEVGNMVFDNFALLDNKQSGFNVYLTNRTDEEVILRNSVVVGKSLSNGADDTDLVATRGVITPRTDGFKLENVHFAQFGPQMTALKSCSFCFHFKKWVQGGKLTRFAGISYFNVTQKMYWDPNWRREIYEDTDGSLTGTGPKSWVTPTGVHLVNQASCVTSTSDVTTWDNGVICTKQIVRVEFSNPEKLVEFQTAALYVKPTNANGDALGDNVDAAFYVSKTVKIKNHAHDLLNGFVGTFLAGEIFSVQWMLSGIDFTHMSVQLSPYHTGNTPDDTLVLKFPYSDYRETFEIGQMIANSNIAFYKNVTANQEPAPLANIKAKTCKHGDWYNDVTNKALYLCLNDYNRAQSSPNQKLERTDVNALKCKLNCPLPPGKCLKDGIPRRLSQIATWQNVLQDGITYNPPTATELLIPCPWEVIVDQSITSYKTIVVQGTLRIDPTKDIDIKAYGIWIKGGTIIAEGATAGSTYTKKLTFELQGNKKDDTQFIADDTIEVGNKVIFNTGSFVLRGNSPSSTATRLTVSANPADTTITVDSAAGWNIGDSIAIAATQLQGNEEEKFTITGISGNTVTLNAPIQFYHFGSNSITLTETWGSYTQNLDLRAKVLHLTRNILIKGAPVSDNIVWGCRVLSFYWAVIADASGNILPVEQQLNLRGTLDWNGVEMSNCGQADTVRGALDFQKCGIDPDQVISVVQNSAIHDCPGYCANIEQSANIIIKNTNFFFGRPILMRIYDVNKISVTGNHFVAARKRDYPFDTSGMFYDMNAAIYFYFTQDPIDTAVLVSNNEVQGSEGPCLVLPHTSCDNSSNISSTVGIFGNQAQTCLIGVMFKFSSDGCQWAGKVAVARATKGFMVNPTRPGIIVENVLAAESDRSVILRFANEGEHNVGKFIDSAIYGVAITNSAEAYNTASKAATCKSNSGTQNLVVTRGGEDFPLKVMPLAFDVICNSEVFDSALFQVNVKYVRFRKIYTDPNLALCGDNHMMVTHPSASDATAGTYNTNVSCVDCTQDSYFNFMSPNPVWGSWFGGCGLFLCTGPENVLNVDFTGTLFNGKPSTGISHNAGIKTAKCQLQSNWNQAYSCDGTDYAQVEWESRAPDFNKRSNAPVMVTSLDGTYTNKINMFREWVWDGNEPMNLRENRFLSTTIINKIYKVEYNGLNPYDIVHRIQPRTLTGEPNIWVGYSVTYQIPMNIEISVEGGAVVPSYLVSDNIDLTTKTSVCGANIYDWTTRTVQFVFNGSLDCIVRAVVLDTVRIQAKVVLTVAEFFNDDVKASFISKVASFLQITDYSRIKIVGINTSTGRFLQTGTTTTTPAAPSFDLIFDITNKQTGNIQQDPATIYKDLTQKAAALKAALDQNTVPGLSPNTYYITKSEVMVSTDSAGGIYGKNTDTKPIVEQSSSSDSDNTLAIILGVVIGLVVISIAVVAFCAYRRYKQRKSILAVQQAEIDHSVINHGKETAKVHPIALDPASDQLQEKANCSSAPFQN